MRAIQRIVQILNVQVDFKAGLVVALEHHGGLGVHHRAARKAALDCFKHQLGVNARLLRQCQCFGQSLDVAGHNNLIGQLGGVARTHIAAAHDRCAHCFQQGLEPVKHFLLAADHEGQTSVDGLGLSAGNRGVQHFNAFFLKYSVDLLAGYRIDAAHVDKGGTGLHRSSNAVLTQHNALDMRTVGQHGKNNVTAFADLPVAGGFCAAGNNLLHIRPVQIADG